MRQHIIMRILLLVCLVGCAAPLPPQPPAATALIIPAADQLLRQAQYAQQLGDDTTLEQTIRLLLEAYPQAAEAREARFLQAMLTANRGQWETAAQLFAALLDENNQPQWQSRALFWLARCHEAAGAHREAIADYTRYLAISPAAPLAAYARLRRAAQYRVLGQLSEAADDEQTSATDRSLPPGIRAQAYERAIDLALAQQNNSKALSLTNELLGFARIPSYRARILLEAAEYARAAGDLNQSRRWLTEVISSDPQQPQAQTAIDQLIADPQATLDPAVVARTLLTQERYQAALPWFDQAISETTSEAALELRRLRGTTLQALQQFEAAQQAYRELISSNPDHPSARQAQLDQAQTSGQAGDGAAALAAYQTFAQQYPSDPLAVEALSRAAIWLDRLGDPQAAQQQRLALAQQYPASQQARDSLWLVARQQWQTQQWAEAQANWERHSQLTRGAIAARSAFWAGKAAQQRGDQASAQALWQQVISQAPWRYEAARARELLGQSAAEAWPLGAASSTDDWRVAEQWLAIWSGVSAEQYASAAQSPPLEAIRAAELRQVGLLAESDLEWLAAIEAQRQKPLELYRLIRAAEQASASSFALRASAVLLELAPEAGIGAPAALLRVLFPAPYAPQIQAAAARHGLDPRLVLALLRQESLFDTDAVSSAGARGIAQVMPATGEAIARKLQISQFVAEDLNRPMVGIQFGASYLGDQLQAFGNPYAALAAYNGGPGNAQRWGGAQASTDPDGFVERIDFPETQQYVQLVWGYYAVYRELYQP